jgi:hypothetical protein
MDLLVVIHEDEWEYQAFRAATAIANRRGRPRTVPTP